MPALEGQTPRDSIEWAAIPIYRVTKDMGPPEFRQEIDTINALARRGELSTALARAEAGIYLTLGGPASEAYWAYFLSKVWIVIFQGCFRQADSLLSTAFSTEPPTLEMSLRWRYAKAHTLCRLAKYRESRLLMEDTYKLACDAKLTQLQAELAIGLGGLHYQIEKLDDSQRLFGEGLDIARVLGDRYLEALAQFGLTKNQMMRGFHTEATAAYKDLKDKAAELDARLLYAVVCCEIAWGYYNLGNYTESLNMLTEPEQILREAGARWHYQICLADIGNAYSKSKCYPLAVGYLTKALEIAEEVGDLLSQRKWLKNLAIAHCSLGDRAGTERFLKRASTANDLLAQARLDANTA